MTKFLDREIKYGDQSPFSEYVRCHADIMTVAIEPNESCPIIRQI
jgi:hypothetical protein